MGNCACKTSRKNLIIKGDNNIPTLDDLFKDVILQAKVVNIYDGDTCKIVCEYPIKGRLVRFPCRMYGYDSPEMKPPKDSPNRDQEKEAALKAKNFLSEIFINNKNIVWARCMGLDKYGRLLATLHYTENDATKNIYSINDKMIESGHGYPYTGGTKEKFVGVSV